MKVVLMDLFFVTGNKGKVETLNRALKLKGVIDINLVQSHVNLIEPQFDSISEVSKYKAMQAFEILKSPVLVEDGGLFVDALNGFPGVYTKYVLETIGVEGILKILSGEKNRKAKFQSYTTFVDEKGNLHQFEREDIEYDIALEKKDEIITSKAWSELWKVIYVREFGKLLCEFTDKELDEYYLLIDKKGSLQKFVDWFINIKK